jgi:hypothetical protein
MTTTVNAWEVTVYDPDDVELPEEDRKIILNDNFRTIKIAHKEIASVLKPHGMEISEISVRKISNGTYESRTSKLFKSIKITKIKLEKSVNYKKI